jgi:hypothetical protein
MLTGSIAMGFYVIPRATKDIDFVVHLQPHDIAGFVNHFEGAYYCSEDAVKDAVNRRSMFNVIDHKSGAKANFAILSNDILHKTEFERRRQADFFGMNFWLASPEDLLHLSIDKPMHDTPDHVKKIQLEIWLSKPVEERLLLTLQMNDELFAFWAEVKKNMALSKNNNPGNHQ